MNDLTRGQREFITYVEIDGMTKEKAYLKAYPRCKQKHVRWAISQVMQKESIKNYYAKINKKMEKKVMLSKEKVHNALENILDTGMQLVPAKDKSGLPILDVKGEQVYIQLDSNAVHRSMNEFNKMVGGHAPVRQEVEQTMTDVSGEVKELLKQRYENE